MQEARSRRRGGTAPLQDLGAGAAADDGTKRRRGRRGKKQEEAAAQPAPFTDQPAPKDEDIDDLRNLFQ
jgi:hypothetical protein